MMAGDRIGFIGLGRMGSGMAGNLMAKVGPIHVCDMNTEAVTRLTAKGAVAAANPAAIAERCDLVFLCVPFAPEVRAALFGASGLTSTGRRGFTVVDTTTLDRTDALDIARAASEAGIAYWDCPISGMPFRAENGTLTVMFGGTEEAFSATKPYLEAFGRDVIHCGALGSGQAMKAINNIVYNVNIAAICEALPLALAVGLDVDAVARVMTTASSRSFASEYFIPRMMERRFDSDFAMEDAYKDIVNVQHMAIETGAMLPVISAMIASYQSAMAVGHGRQPKSAILKIYEQALGVEFRKATIGSGGDSGS
ncbi:MAG: NAD(P)-dependent oxidoreductase [Hyphomicrobiaceae bacterium]